MKTGLFSNARRDLSLIEFLDYAGELGVDMVEIGCGEETGTRQCNPSALLKDEDALNAFLEALNRNHLEVSALSCHGNPISPNRDQARISDDLMRNAVLLAERIGLKTIVCFSGCPGGDSASRYINWVTVSWPMDLRSTSTQSLRNMKAWTAQSWRYRNHRNVWLWSSEQRI